MDRKGRFAEALKAPASGSRWNGSPKEDVEFVPDLFDEAMPDCVKHIRE